MSHIKLAEQIGDFATENKEASVRDFLNEIAQKTTEQDFLLAVGYAVHYKDDKKTSIVCSRILHALKTDIDVEDRVKKLAASTENCHAAKVRVEMQSLFKSNLTTMEKAKVIADGVYYSNGPKEQSLLLRFLDSTYERNKDTGLEM